MLSAVSSVSAGCKPAGRTGRRPVFLLHYEQEQQLSVAHLRAFDDDRALSAQLRVPLQEKIALLKQLQVYEVTRLVVPFLGIDVERKIFTLSQPIFRAGHEDLPGLADDFILVVTEPILERFL